ncbi:TMEM14 family protein [Nostoc parmelioides]|uniref:Small integral membrane protein n=1 Tax=Nostoc parmelioides FACHB-3921 TaxID=2692909 RepID=A0ABR8B9S0_9NOSO|nr:TMEM14 family protein [Nostoc parmelioides]MBD2250214.1 hypothetical protein [Nostoc parmelioides FACHB-3921]
MNLSVTAAIAYGMLALIGGIIGYFQANSQVSLLSGVVSGLLLFVAAYLQLQGQTWGLILATVVTAALVVFFALRLVRTRKFMPAGLMTILGMLSLVVLLNQMVAPK